MKKATIDEVVKAVAKERTNASPFFKGTKRDLLSIAMERADNILFNGTACPNDTDGDGNCGRPGCVICGGNYKETRRVTEAISKTRFFRL